MKTYSGFHALYMCFFSKDLYRSVVRNWKGVAFLYLFLLIMTSWALISLKVFFVINETMTGPVKKIIDKLPVVTIHDGELKIDKPSPYVLTLPSSDTADASARKSSLDLPIAVFDDTTDDVKGEDSVPFIITKHNFFIQSKDGKAQQFELKQFGEVVYNKQTYKEIADAITLWVPILIFVVAGPVSFIISAITTLILGAIGMGVAGGSSIKLTYGEAVRIAAVAFTPAVLLDTVLKLAGVPMNMLWMIVPFCLALAYTIFGVFSNKEPIIVESSMPGGMPQTSTMDQDQPPTDHTTPMT